MTKPAGWVSAQQLCDTLELDRKTLFRMRDDGSLKLGQHYAAFKGYTFSRDSYQWNIHHVKKALQKMAACV